MSEHRTLQQKLSAIRADETREGPTKWCAAKKRYELASPHCLVLRSKTAAYHIVGGSSVVRHGKMGRSVRYGSSLVTATPEICGVRFIPESCRGCRRPGRQFRAMCGRLRVGKENLHVAGLVGAAMCSAFRCGSHDRWP